MERNSIKLVVISKTRPSQIKMANKLIQLKDGNDNAFPKICNKAFPLMDWGDIPSGTHQQAVRVTENSDLARNANEIIFVCQSGNVYKYAYILTPFNAFQPNGSYYEVPITDGKIKVWIAITTNDGLIVDVYENTNAIKQIFYHSNQFSLM